MWLQNPQQISGSQIQQYFTYTMTTWDLSRDVSQGWFDIQKFISMTHHVNKLENKDHMIMSIKAEKTFDKIQHLLVIKALNKVVVESAYLNIIEAICGIPTGNTSGENPYTQW